MTNTSFLSSPPLSSGSFYSMVNPQQVSLTHKIKAKPPWYFFLLLTALVKPNPAPTSQVTLLLSMCVMAGDWCSKCFTSFSLATSAQILFIISFPNKPLLLLSRSNSKSCFCKCPRPLSLGISFCYPIFICYWPINTSSTQFNTQYMPSTRLVWPEIAVNQIIT